MVKHILSLDQSQNANKSSKSESRVTWIVDSLGSSLYSQGFGAGGVFVSMACWMVQGVRSGKRLVAEM